MLTSIENAVIALLREKGLPAVPMYPAAALDIRRPVLAVAVKHAVISSSGLGDYIGIAEEDGEIRELYGFGAELQVEIRAYSPPVPQRTGSLDLLENALDALRGGQVKIRSSEIAGEFFDGRSEMFRSEARLNVRALLVREKRGQELGDPRLGEEDA